MKYAKVKGAQAAMEEIDSNPDVLLLGKDPEASTFLELIYPNKSSGNSLLANYLIGFIDLNTNGKSRQNSGSIDAVSVQSSVDSHAQTATSFSPVPDIVDELEDETPEDKSDSEDDSFVPTSRRSTSSKRAPIARKPSKSVSRAPKRAASKKPVTASAKKKKKWSDTTEDDKFSLSGMSSLRCVN